MSSSINMIPTSSTYSRSFELPNPNLDCVSSFAFVNSSSAIVSSSWDGQVRTWQVLQDRANPFSVQSNEEPVLSLCEKPSSTSFFASLTNGSIKMFDLNNPQNFRLIGKHNHCASCVRFLPSLNVLATGGWDSCIHFWDTNQPNPVHSIKLNGRVSAMDSTESFLVVGLNNREVYSLNLKQNNFSEMKLISSSAAASPLSSSASFGFSSTSSLGSGFGGRNVMNSNSTSPVQNQSKGVDFPIQSLCILANEKSIAVSQTNGSVTLLSLSAVAASGLSSNPSPNSQNFGFSSTFASSSSIEEKNGNIELHEKPNSSSYFGKKSFLSANSVVSHSMRGVFVSSGGDGKSHFVNRYEMRKLFTLDSAVPGARSGYISSFSSSEEPLAITASCFDKSCKYFARAYSYDWAKGIKGYDKEKMKPKIYINYRI